MAKRIELLADEVAVMLDDQITALESAHHGPGSGCEDMTQCTVGHFDLDETETNIRQGLIRRLTPLLKGDN